MANAEQEYEALRNELTQVEQQLASIYRSLKDQSYVIAETASNFVTYKNILREVKVSYTQIEHLSDSILDMSNRLGTSLIRQTDIEKIKNRLNSESLQLNQIEARTYQKRIEDLDKIKGILQTNNIAFAGGTANAVDMNQVLLDIESKIQSITNNTGTLTSQNKAIVEQLNVQKEILSGINTERDTAIRYITEERKQIANLQTQLDEVEKKSGKANNVYKKMNAEIVTMSKALRFISKIPVLGDLYDRESLARAKNMSSFMAEFGSQTKNLLGSGVVKLGLVVAALGAAMKLINIGVKLAVEYEKSVNEISNSLGAIKEASEAVYDNFYEVSRESYHLNGVLYAGFSTMKNMGLAMHSIQEAFSTSAFINEKMLESQIFLTKQLGLTEEAAAGIQKYSVLTGKNSIDIVNLVLKQNKYFIANKKLITEMAKASAEIVTSYKTQPELLAKATAQAMKLGMTLEDTRKISDSLLNFETSIESELKAELLLGKELNYEKARSLALEGKSAEAAAELVRQTGGLNELNKMNVITRKALAESIGLSSEELTKFAQQEEVLSKLGAKSIDDITERHRILMQEGRVNEANALLESVRKQQNGEILAQDIAKVSLAARYEATMEKIKEIFVKHSGLITGILDKLLRVLETVDSIGSMFTAISAMMGSASSWADMAFKIESNMTPVTGVSAVKDAAISPSQGLMISTPKGEMFRTDPEDIVYATPKPPAEMMNADTGSPQKPVMSNVYSTPVYPNEMMSRTTTVPQKSVLPKEKLLNTETQNTIVRNESTTNVNQGVDYAKKVEDIEKILQDMLYETRNMLYEIRKPTTMDSYALGTRMALSNNFSFA